MMSKEQSEQWFAYQAPTDVTGPKHAAIRTAATICADTLREVLARVGLSTETYEAVNRATRQFAMVIDQTAPDCADKTAALRCVRLVRNAANESVSAGGDTHKRLGRLMDNEMDKARWQANAAIALDGR